MARFPALRVSRAVRLFSAIGLVVAAGLQLGWTPAAPWTPTINLLSAAASWAPTRPLVWLLLDAMDGAYAQLQRIPPW